MDSAYPPLVVINIIISFQAAAEYSGNRLHYLRRLLRIGKLEGFKIGQVWLIEQNAFEVYMKKAI